MTQAHFAVSGEFVTEHFRGIVQEGRWRDAVEQLKDSVIDFSDDFIHLTLSGAAKLEGVDQVQLYEDDKAEDIQWARKFYYHYFNKVILVEGKFYKAFGRVNELEYEQLSYLFEEKKDRYFSDDEPVSNILRAKHYRRETDDIILFNAHSDSWVIASLISLDYPVWINKEMLGKLCISMEKVMQHKFTSLLQLDDAELDFLEVNKISVFTHNNKMVTDPVLDNFIESQKLHDEPDSIENIKKEISKQAEKKGGWLNVHDKNNDLHYRLPKAPFLRWCLSNSTAYQSIDWDPVSLQGLKCAGDDPFHTDWWLFTGLSLDDAHDSEQAQFFFKERHKQFCKLTSSNVTPFCTSANHKGFSGSFVRHITSPTEVEMVTKDAIVIIPNASPIYEPIAYACVKNNAILLTETGGKLCHLATIGRELKLTLYMLPNAKKRLPIGTKCSFDTENHIIKALDMEVEQLIKLKLSGLFYRNDN